MAASSLLSLPPASSAVPPAVPLVSQEVIVWFEDLLYKERLRIDATHKGWLQELELKLIVSKAQAADAASVPDLCHIAPAPENGIKSAVGAADLQEQKKASDAVASPPRGRFLAETHAAEGVMASIVQSNRFEVLFAVLIISNLVFMCLEAQYRGLGVGYDIAYPAFTSRNHHEDVWTGMDSVLHIADVFFGVMYTIEVVLKLGGLRSAFLDVWNLLDLFIVVLWYIDMIATNVELPVDAMVLRILRLVKVARLMKLAHALAGLEQLLLMITALKGCMRMLFWTAVLLLSCLVGFALLLHQTLVTHLIVSGAGSDKAQHTCFKYFGTFARAMFSMLELTLGNWVPIGRFLMEDVSEFSVIFTIAYKLSFGFAIIAVINGCFIKETFKLVEDDDHLMILRKDGERKVHFTKMMALLDAADSSGDGTLTKREFEDVCLIPEVNKWLGAQGLRVADADQLFELLDDGGGILSKKELIEGVNKVKGPSRSLDLAFLMKEHHKRGKEVELILETMAATENNLRDGQRTLVDGQATLITRLCGQLLPQIQAQISGTADHSAEFSKLAGDIAHIKNELSKRNSYAVPMVNQVRVQDGACGGVYGPKC